MKGVFWNCNGLGDLKKFKFLSDLTLENNLDFIALSEMGRGDCTQVFLKNLCGGKDFLWHVKPPRGKSGGMLLGINLLRFDIGEIEGEFFVKFKIRNKDDGFQWLLVSVYGAAQPSLKESFLTKLAHLCAKDSLPMILRGDFNIIRGPREKSNSNYNDIWPFLFNAIIDAFNLKELDLSGRKFTWANNLQNPTFEKLDIILMSTEWELKFPKSYVQALTREISDHTPLFTDTGNPSSSNSHPYFKFELGWLLREGFMDMVKEIWASVQMGNTPLERWQAKIRRLRQYLRGWAKNTSGAYKKEKKALLDKLDELDKKQNTYISMKKK